MNAAGYDVATMGNHEFDYGMKRALEVSTSGEAEYTYLSANFYDIKKDNQPVLDAYKMYDFNGTKVAFVGITTPETFTKSTPAYFMNEEQTEYIYGIYGGADGQELYTAVQTAIDSAKAEGADYVIAVAHCGDDGSSAPWRSRDVIANTTGFDAFIDGHSHTTMPQEEVKDKAGNTVILSQTGNYYNAIGQMTITDDGISAKLLDKADITIEDDAKVKAIQDAWVAEVDGKLNVEIAETSNTFYIKDENGIRLIRKMETNLGDLNADAWYYYFNMVEKLDCDIAFMNGGGIRAEIAAGNWTYKTCKTVNTFGNILCLMEVSGQTILDALEWGARVALDEECGGYLNVAGMSYKVDTTIPSTVQKDDKNVWTGSPTGDYRVYDVKIYNKETKTYEPLDLSKTYTLAGINYTLRNMGDGFNMFTEAKLVKDYVSEDYLALAAYISSFTDTDGNGLANIATANSPLNAYENYLLNYEERLGAGRIIYAEKHDLDETTIAGTPATCTEDGLTDGVKCSICGEIITKQKVIPALGHTWDDGKVTTKPTTSTEGVKTYTCTVCGDTQTEPVAKLTSVSKATVTATKKVYYTGKKQKISVKVVLNGETLKAGTDYTLGNTSFTGVGKHKVTVTGKGNYAGTVSAYVYIEKGKQPMTISPTSKHYRTVTMKKKNSPRTVTIQVKNAQGSVSFKSSNTKYVTVTSKGKVTVKKNTPKGTYKVTVSAKGNGNYSSGSKTLTITVK